MPENIEIIVGEFYPQPATGNWVFASVYAQRRITGRLTVVDKKGQVQLTVPFELEKEGDVIEMQIHALSPGDYRVFIKIMGEEWERRLQVRN